MRRRRGYGGTITVDVDVDVDTVLDSLSDEEILEEVARRDLAAAATRAKLGSTKAMPGNVDESLDNVYRDLMARRPRQAENALAQVIDDLIGRDLVAALDAIRAGRIGDAICCLERYRRPTPAAKATPADLTKADAPAPSAEPREAPLP